VEGPKGGDVFFQQGSWVVTSLPTLPQPEVERLAVASHFPAPLYRLRYFSICLALLPSATLSRV